MPKLRNSESDLGGFMQWLGRKCRNHHPLAELGMAPAQRQWMPDQHKHQQGKGGVYAVKGDDSRIVYRAAGRNFILIAEEVGDEAVDQLELVAVGF